MHLALTFRNIQGDNMIDDAVVQAKKSVAEELAVASGIEYIMYPGSVVMSTHILDDKSNSIPYSISHNYGFGMVAGSLDSYKPTDNNQK